MSKISEITRQSWIESTFPEWGTWLVEDIENEVVAPGNVAMWWLGCTGIWFKTPEDTNITIDLWCGNGKRTHGDGKMKVGHQMANMCGGRAMQPNLRNVPFVIDPFAFKKVDAVLATHYHQDHMSPEWAAHVINSGMTTTDENGKEINRYSLCTAGKETVLQVRPEEKTVKPEGLAFIQLQYTDNKGIWKPMEKHNIKVTVENGVLKGLGSPAPYVKGNYTDHTVATYYGEAMAVVQADGNGPVKVTVADEERFYVVEIPCE